MSQLPVYPAYTGELGPSDWEAYAAAFVLLAIVTIVVKAIEWWQHRRARRRSDG